MVGNKIQIVSTRYARYGFHRIRNKIEKPANKCFIHLPAGFSILFFAWLNANAYYFLKKSGILIDCSFTVAFGALGVSRVGVVPPTDLLGICVVPPPCVGAAPKSIFGA